MQLVLQALIDLEATATIGAGRYERSPEPVTHRDGARERLLSTKAGDLELQIPKLRRGASSRRCWSHVDGSTEQPARSAFEVNTCA